MHDLIECTHTHTTEVIIISNSTDKKPKAQGG